MIEWNGFIESQLSTSPSAKRIRIIQVGKDAVSKVFKRSSKRAKKK